MTTSVLLADRAASADLATYLGRARRVDDGGAARLIGAGDALAVYVCPVHGSGGPTVLGLRVLRTAGPAADVTAAGVKAQIDVTVPLAALTDRLARLVGPADAGPGTAPGDPSASDPVELPLPPMAAAAGPSSWAGVSWAGVAPPRSGWQPAGTVPDSALALAARAGVAEVAAGAPAGAGAAAVGRLRALVWGRDLPGFGGLPAGAAFAADALGFVVPGEPAALYRSGRWCRLTTARGHVLSRPALI
jgi:hypothetical protein